MHSIPFGNRIAKAFNHHPANQQAATLKGLERSVGKSRRIYSVGAQISRVYEEGHRPRMRWGSMRVLPAHGTENLAGHVSNDNV